MSWFHTLIPYVHAAAIAPAGNADPNSTQNAAIAVDNATASIINVLFLIGGILAVLYLLWAGIQYISAGGNMDRAKTARQAILNAVIGIIIMMASFAIIRFATGVGRGLSNIDKQGTVKDFSK